MGETAQDLQAVSDPGHLETSSHEVNVMVVFLEICMTPDMAFWLILISDEKQCCMKVTLCTSYFQRDFVLRVNI